MIWEKAEIDSNRVREISERYDIDLLTAAILVRRGVTESADLKYYLEEDLRYVHSPFLFEEMEDAVDRIIQAQTEGEKVLVYGDRDVDGITSTALMVETLRDLGLNVEWAVPMGDDPYGLSVAEVEQFAESKGTLIVAVDCGTTNNREIERAVELGVDTIVIDHHNPQDELPPAVAIINPKLSDSGYPFQGLCACALSAKLRQALSIATSPAYGDVICLVNARPGNDTVIIDAVKIQNLVEIDRITETIAPGVVLLDQTRFFQFVQGQPISVYDETTQKKLLRDAFGQSVEIYLHDIADEVWKAFPTLRDKSLLWMGENSRLSRYSDDQFPSEMEVLRSLFTVFFAKSQPQVDASLSSALDLVALGTLADMMPLQDENRVLVRRGLSELAATRRSGLKALLEHLDLGDRTLASTDVGWQLTPTINASGRMGEPDKAVRLLLSDDPREQSRLAEEVATMNRERKRTGDEAWKRVLPKAKESAAAYSEKLIIVEDDAIHRGITGILAGKLARTFNLPAIVLSLVDDRIVGSIRSARGFCATDFLKRFDEILDDWGGHDAAAGFHLRAHERDRFLEQVAGSMELLELEDDTEQRITIDAEIPATYMTPKLWETLDRLEPYGQQNPRLTFLVRGARIDQLQFIGKASQDHVRMLIDVGTYKWPAVFWNGADKVETEFSATDTVDVVFEIGRNYFQKRENLQLVLLDVRRTGVVVESA